MTTPIRLWTCAAHHHAFLCGGWAAVRSRGGAVTGLAGGERRTTATRMALAGLAAGLADLPGGGSEEIIVETSSHQLFAFAPLLANLDSPPADPPVDDLDLWARIVSAGRNRRLRVSLSAPTVDTATGFVSAWADFAMDRAKTRGTFATAIPKANLAKAPGIL